MFHVLYELPEAGTCHATDGNNIIDVKRCQSGCMHDVSHPLVWYTLMLAGVKPGAGKGH